MTTHRTIGKALAALAAAAIVATSGTAHAASADPTGLDPEVAAKVAREKIKQTQRGAQFRDGGGDAGGGRNDKCGQVDIGNDNSKDRSAASRLNERSRTVVVTGPVINAARCR